MNLTNYSNNVLQQIDITKHPLHLYAKDRDGKYIEINEHFAQDTGFSKAEEIQGLRDFDLSFLPSQQASLLRSNDTQTVRQAKPQFFIETVSLVNGNSVTALSHKMPLYGLTKKIIGITGVSIILNKKVGWSSILNCATDAVDFLLEGSNLTTREIECLFHLIKGKTAKLIANILAISSRTVEQHLINCKIKLGCNTRFELIEKAFNITAIKELLKKELN